MQLNQRLCLSFLILAFMGCASSESLESEFWSLLQEGNSCVEDLQCVLVESDCWLPCGDAAVNPENIHRLEHLEKQYMRSRGFLDGNTCIAVPACRTDKRAECVSGQCQVVYSDQAL